MSDSEVNSNMVLELAEEFLDRYRKGERPALREYIERHPELAVEIKEVFPAMAMMENIAVADESLAEGETSEVSKTSELSLRQLGDYRIIREIGHGGMGVVYEAEQVSLGRHVALKVLPHKVLADANTKKRFEREAKAAAKLHHTNIVPVFGVGEHEGLPYYAMQFIQGMGLDKVIEELMHLKPHSSDAGQPALLGSVGKSPKRHATAQQMAQSLLTGVFHADSAEGDEPVAGTNSSKLRNPAPALRRPRPVHTDVALDAPPTSGSPQANGPSAASQQRAMGFGQQLDTSSASSLISGGRDSSDISKSGKQSFWRSVAQLGLQVAEALEYAHGQGILHRDIKPSNLLLDTRGTAWITDFGLAKADDQENLTHTGDILGTVRYMPPEGFEGKSDARGDVYSLGVTLYELAALRPAFHGRDRRQLIQQVTGAEPESLSLVRRGLPRDLETIIHKAIDREPARRYQKAQDLAEDLRRFLEDRPVKARRISSVERLARWARRNRGTAASLGVIALLLIAAAVVAGVAALRFNNLADERELARGAAEEAANDSRRQGEAERRERYRSNIAAASAALQLQNSGAAGRILDDAPKEHRNWEWQYLQSQLDGASFVLPVPGGKVKSLVLSPSGRQIAVCCEEHNEVYLYDVATGKEGAVLRAHTAPVTFVAYRPDGKQVATASNDQTIRLWDPATGQQTALLKAEGIPSNLDRNTGVMYNSDGGRIVSYAQMGRNAAPAGTSRLWDANTGKEVAVLAKWQENSRPAAFSPDGKQVAVGSGEFVHVCDAFTGRQLAVLGPHATLVQILAYVPDGKRMASATAGDGANAIHVWDIERSKEVAVMPAPDLDTMRFSPDGSRLISGSNYPDNKARIWDAASGRLLAALEGHKNSIWGIAFSPDGRRAVTASMDQTARLWDGRTGELVIVLSGHTDGVPSVLFSPNGMRVVTASNDATLRLWDAQTGELIGALRGHGDSFVCPPVFTLDGASLVSGCTDGTVRIWNMGLAERNGILKGHTSYVYDVAFSPDGEQVASAAWDGSARLWDATTGRQTGLMKHETEIITSVAYSPDGRRLATRERSRGVVLWDVASQMAAREWRLTPVGHDPRVSFNPVGTLLASVSHEGPVPLWDVATGREVARLEGHDKDSTDVAFHPNGNLLASAGIDGTVRLWDVAKRVPVAVLRGHTGEVWRVAFSADGKLLASGSNDKTIRLWDVQTQAELAVIPVGSIVYCVAISPDGTRLAAGCRDNTIRLIDVAHRHQVAELRGHTNYVHAVAWSPDGTRLVSGSGDYTVRVWDAVPPAIRARSKNDYVPPKGYVAYRAAPAIVVDGRLDDEAWKAGPWTDDFVDIEGEFRIKPRWQTRAKMLWDDKVLYIGAELEEPHVQGSYTKRDSYIFHEDNDFEVFVNPDGNSHNYAELEMNALNTVWDLRLRKPYRDGGPAEDNWHIPGLKTAVHVNGTINNPRDVDKGWTLEIAIPWEIVRALNDKPAQPPRDGDQWRINFSRVQWRYDIIDGKYVRRKDRREDNWVWSPQWVVDMHRPELWGYVQFSTEAPGTARFRPDAAGPAKHLLQRIYHAQRAFHKDHKRYAAALDQLDLPGLKNDWVAAPPVIEAIDGGYRATVEIRLADGTSRRWRIRQDSLVEPVPEK